MILRQEKTKGFSLIELVIVVSLLSLLATITVPHFQYYLKKKQQAECDQIAYQIRQLFVEYILEGAYQPGYSYPLKTKFVDESENLENDFQVTDFVYFTGVVLRGLNWRYQSDYKMSTVYHEETKKAIVKVDVKYLEGMQIQYTFELTEALVGDYDTAILLSFIYYDSNGCQKELFIQ